MRNWFTFFEHVKNTGFNPTSIVDIGIATGTDELYRHFPRARYLLVEPLKEFEQHLQMLCSQFPGSNYMLAAAGPEEGHMVIHVGPGMGDSSRFKTLMAEDGAYEMPARTVPQYRIDTMWDTLNFTGPALLKVDVQGGELEVLKGAEKTLPNFEMIVLETPLTQNYVGAPIFHEYIAYLAARDFVLYDIIHTGYADTGMLAELDLVFVKKDGRFRQDQRCIIDYDKARSLDNHNGVRMNAEFNDPTKS